jgi:hypothetical protein
MIRRITEKDFDRVLGWFSARGIEKSLKGILPKDFGYIVNESCAFFLYTASNAPVCFFEWVISDPEQSPVESVKNLKELAGYIEDMARNMKKEGMVSFLILSNEKLCRLFNGFCTGCNGETTMVYEGGK